MKKLVFIIATTVMALALGGCSSNDSDFEVNPDPEINLDSATGVEIISQPVEIKLGTPSVHFTRAALEDDSQELTIGVFCLAREKQNVNKTAQDISWWDTSIDPLYRSTFCLLNNVRSTKKSSGDVTWVDGQRRYYPFTQFYAYDFYTYYPYVPFGDNLNGNSIDTTKVGKVYVNYASIDGKTDILWGRATSDKAYAYSAKYFRQPGNVSETPNTQLDHMLTRLKFQVVPGESVVGNEDYSAASKLMITSLKVKDVVKNVTLLVADYNRDSANEHGTDAQDGTDEPDRLTPTNDEVQTLSLCGADGNPFGNVDVPSTPNTPAPLGESFLLYPAGKYVLEITLTNKETMEVYEQDHPLELVHPQAASGGVFEAGRLYTITLEVHGPKEVSIRALITPWVDTDLSGDDQIEL